MMEILFLGCLDEMNIKVSEVAPKFKELTPAPLAESMMWLKYPFNSLMGRAINSEQVINPLKEVGLGHIFFIARFICHSGRI